MKITGYRTLTEKECDYLTVRPLLEKHGMLVEDIQELLGVKLSPKIVHPNTEVDFCVICDSSEELFLRLSTLPENTKELYIRTT